MKRFIPGLLFFLFAGSLSAQNVLFFQGEGNLIPLPGIGGPSWIGGSAGTNLLLYRTLIQTDIALFFGGMTVEDESGKKQNRLMLKVSDALFASYTMFPGLGLRGGLSAGLGVYSAGLVNGFINIGLLAGVHILPESAVSWTVDIQPGYALTFHYDTDNSNIFSAFSLGSHHGVVFPITAGVRLNFDRF
ncbi:MAG: hypothetical protein LBU28_11205 [Spirochaetaceae bacterium]|jgi:hypothetical protein|nr:hypothetical protein [Spirochaetaceae bacterium]